MKARVAALALLTSLGLGCSAQDESPIVAATAASLAPAMREVVDRFEAELTTGGSGLLVQQILRGAPVDVFISASPVEIERLRGAGLLVDGAGRAIASNRLLVVAPRGSRSAPGSVADLTDERFARIAVANPRTAPLGRYTEQALRAASVYERLAPRLVFAENARHTLDYVARGEADAGIVYASDGRIAPVDVAFVLDLELHDPIIYYAAVVASGAPPDRAAGLIEFLVSVEGRRILGRHGLEAAP